MLKEAITKIEELAQAGQHADVVEVEGDPTTVYIAHNGKLVPHKIPQTPTRRHSVQTLDDLADVVKNHAILPAAGDGGSERPTATVWHDYGCVVAYLDAPQPLRNDRVSMTLITSPVFQRLDELDTNEGEEFGQREFIRLLSFDFHKAGDFAQLITSARSLKFDTQKMGESTIIQGRESLGRQVIAEVKGVADFPEEFTVTYPVYVNPDLAEFQATVACSLEIDVAREKFIVRPKPAEILNARQQVHAIIGEKLGELLVGTGVPVYYGRP